MAYPIPTLKPLAAQVLRMVKERGVVRGYDVLSVTGSSREDLLEAVQELLRNDFVHVSGGLSNTEQLGRAYLTFLPSSAAVADVTLRAAR